MDPDVAPPPRTLSRVLAGVAWFLVALAAYVLWTLLGLTLFTRSNLASLVRPAPPPLWRAYAALVLQLFVWPLVLMLITGGARRLNRGLARVLETIAALSLVGAALVILLPSVLFSISLPVVLGRHLATVGTPAQALFGVLQAALTGLVVVVAGWSNKRFNLTRRRHR